MLVAPTADTGGVLRRILASTALICCAFVAASFGLFALDQVAGASKHQQNQISAGVPTNPGPVPEPKRHGQPRRFIDDTAHTLTAPFRSIVSSDSAWVSRGIPTICALVVYGLGLGYLARYSSGLS